MRREDDLRAAMQLLADDPPTVADVIGVVTPSGEKRRRGVWILPAAAAAVTLAVVLTVTALVSGGRNAQPPQTRQPPGIPTELAGVHWILASVQKDGAAPTHGGASLLIRRYGRFIVNFRCGSWQGVAQFGDGHASFRSGTFFDHSCPYTPLNDAADIRTVESVVDGAVRWSLQDRMFTISKPGKGSLTFLPASISATIRGRLLALGGPAGVPARPLNGTVTVTEVGGRATHTVAVGSDGRYMVHVAPGRYQVQGRSPLYQGGNWPCNAAKPADAENGTTTTADVYCQEK